MIKRLLIVFIFLYLATAVYTEAAEHSIIVAVKGMTCPVCPVAVKKSLSAIEGVKSVKVSLEEKKAWLTVSESVTDDMIIEALKATGMYKGKVIERK